MAKGILGSCFDTPKTKRDNGFYAPLRANKQKQKNVRREFYAACSRPSKQRVRNTSYREQAGTIGKYISTHRFSGSKITCVCYSVKI